MDTTPQRYPELDLLRALAVIAMVLYHLLFDLSIYYGYQIDVVSGTLAFAAKSTASLFLMLVGVCFVISWERTAPEIRVRKYAKRMGIVLAGALIVSAVTWLVDPGTFVVFGILHLIGAAVIVQYVLRPLGRWNVLIGVLVFSTITFLPTGGINTPLLLPLGIMEKGFASVDYYPLLPWLGPIILGMGIGDVLYVPARARFLLIFDTVSWPRWLLWTGRRSLPIYFIHQPVLLFLLWMLLGR